MVTTAAYPPPPTPLLPPAVNVTPSPTLAPSIHGAAPSVTIVDVAPANDVHQLSTPAASGAILNMMPGDHPIERAAVATQQLRQEQAEKKMLESREQQLKAELAQREKSIREATHEVKEATEEIRQTRTALQNTVLESDDKLAALRKREQADAFTIKEILKKLDRPAEPITAPAPTPEEHTPMRPIPEDPAPMRP
jgi:septal ring factor EnvC (AmiA/AmiB activator)